MITTLMLVFTALLLIFAILDLKSKAIPSVLLTGTIFILVGLNFGNLKWAVLTGLMGMLLWEFSEGNKVAFGVADIKIMIMLGFFLTSFNSFFFFMLSFAVCQMVYIAGVRWFLKMDEVPFVPLFFVLWIAGLVAGGMWG
jgi:xanthosine utilization system XapX-like protein